MRRKNTTPLCFYILQGRVVFAGEKIRFVSKGEGEVVPVFWAREREEVWGLNELFKLCSKMEVITF